MNAMRQPLPITLEEFDAMAKDELLNYELIDGIVLMSPSPSRNHQYLNAKLIAALYSCLKDTPCGIAPELDIRAQGQVFKPDLQIFCDQEDDLPQLVIEILSPSSKYRDMVLKLAKYEAIGIAEYWIIDPDLQTVTVHDFVHQYTASYGADETIVSPNLPDVVIKAADIFA